MVTRSFPPFLHNIPHHTPRSYKRGTLVLLRCARIASAPGMAHMLCVVFYAYSTTHPHLLLLHVAGCRLWVVRPGSPGC